MNPLPPLIDRLKKLLLVRLFTSIEADFARLAAAEAADLQADAIELQQAGQTVAASYLAQTVAVVGPLPALDAHDVNWVRLVRADDLPAPSTGTPPQVSDHPSAPPLHAPRGPGRPKKLPSDVNLIARPGQVRA